MLLKNISANHHRFTEKSLLFSLPNFIQKRSHKRLIPHVWSLFLFCLSESRQKTVYTHSLACAPLPAFVTVIFYAPAIIPITPAAITKIIAPAITQQIILICFLENLITSFPFIKSDTHQKNRCSNKIFIPIPTRTTPPTISDLFPKRFPNRLPI